MAQIPIYQTFRFIYRHINIDKQTVVIGKRTKPIGKDTKATEKGVYIDPKDTQRRQLFNCDIIQ